MTYTSTKRGGIKRPNPFFSGATQPPGEKIKRSAEGFPASDVSGPWIGPTRPMVDCAQCGRPQTERAISVRREQAKGGRVDQKIPLLTFEKSIQIFTMYKSEASAIFNVNTIQFHRIKQRLDTRFRAWHRCSRKVDIKSLGPSESRDPLTYMEYGVQILKPSDVEFNEQFCDSFTYMKLSVTAMLPSDHPCGEHDRSRGDRRLLINQKLAISVTPTEKWMKP